MRRPRKQSGASLDSLLDTMTNVVGILVILLTVTQLGVQEAVKRISSTVKVDPDELRRAEEKLAEVVSLEALLKKQLASLDTKGADPEKLRKDLGLLLAQLYGARHDVEVLKDLQEDRKRAVEAALQKALEEARKAIQEQEEKEKALIAKVNAADQKVASLRAQLADTPELGPVPAKVVNLPNPRAAPEGSQPQTVLCRDGRILWVDVDTLRDRAQKRVDFIIRRRRLGADPAKGIDGAVLAKEFNEDKIRDRHFELQMAIRGRLPYLVFKRRPDAGETTEFLKDASSRYQQRVRRTDPKAYYLQYLVWPDSFETYLEARKIAAKRGLPAGWIAQGGKAEYTIPLGGKLRVGPPPPPAKPAPKPKPGEKPKPPPPPPPKDTID